jgi:hypothetical protein
MPADSPKWLAEWLDLCTLATPGPWTAGYGTPIGADGTEIFEIEWDGCEDDPGSVSVACDDDDEAFIVASNPTRVRWLLEMVRRQSEALQLLGLRPLTVDSYEQGPP